jgi:sigma-54 dependent transcriptional regulator, acetoin dehydrogenase operon transcriptional activator AcoR
VKNAIPSIDPGSAGAAARLGSIALARRAVLQERTPASCGVIAPWVENSWQRCLSLGLRPHERVVFDAVSAQQMRRTVETSQQLVQTARPTLDKLGRAIADTRYFAILTNVDGVVIDVSGAIDRSDPRADNITRIGTDLSERSVGTTAIGAALTDLQPVWLHRGEHFFADTSVYSCAGAPLFGPDGRCVGMLDLTGIDAVERPELKHLVSQSAQKIENALLRGASHHLLLRLNWPGNALGSEADGILSLDGDGWITGANQIARQMVPSLAAPGPASVHASEVFGVACDLLFDAARRKDGALEIPLWTGLRLQALALERSQDAHSLPSMPRLAPADARPLKDIETGLIRQAVAQARGNVAQAALALGISRATVYRKLGKPK